MNPSQIQIHILYGLQKKNETCNALNRWTMFIRCFWGIIIKASSAVRTKIFTTIFMNKRSNCRLLIDVNKVSTFFKNVFRSSMRKMSNAEYVYEINFIPFSLIFSTDARAFCMINVMRMVSLTWYSLSRCLRNDWSWSGRKKNGHSYWKSRWTNSMKFVNE